MTIRRIKLASTNARTMSSSVHCYPSNFGMDESVQEILRTRVSTLMNSGSMLQQKKVKGLVDEKGILLAMEKVSLEVENVANRLIEHTNYYMNQGCSNGTLASTDCYQVLEELESGIISKGMLELDDRARKHVMTEFSKEVVEKYGDYYKNLWSWKISVGYEIEQDKTCFKWEVPRRNYYVKSRSYAG